MKKIFLILIIMIITLNLLFAQVLGDVNNNTSIDIIDALLVAQYYVGLDPSGFLSYVADVDGNSSINIIDALLIAQYYVGLITKFPAANQTPNPTIAPGIPYKILLNPDMIINEVAQGDAGMLVDEQDNTGDPPASDCITTWFVGYTEWYLPSNAVIDLGAEYVITQIYLYDYNGIGDVTISAGTPFIWEELFTYGLTLYMQWYVHDIDNVQTRYIQVSRATTAGLNEIVLYGYPAEPLPELTPEPTPPNFQITMDHFIGVNAFIDDPIDKIAVGGFIREYHSWSWDEGDVNGNYKPYPDNENKWNPSYAAGGAWDFDTYYNNLYSEDIIISPCIQRNVMWLVDNDSSRLNYKPVSPGENPENPFSYAEHADHMFQYAARYGSSQVSDSLLKLSGDQPRISGQGLISYFENWNEPNMWWEGRDSYFNPYELAAMCSADYDGHQSSMGMTLGIKNADTSSKLVMGGIAELNLDYIRAMDFWFKHNRSDGKFAADVINLHHYSNNGSYGICPEEDKLKEKLEIIVKYRNMYLSDKEVWLTEFGWDTTQGSYQSAPSFEAQAQWIVRGYLLATVAGIDRVAMYMLRDVDPNNSTQYSSCGLVGPKGDWSPKQSWYYVYTLKNRLAGMVFTEEQESLNPNIIILKFKEESGNNGSYVLWCPTSNGTTVSGYNLSLSGNPTTANLVQMTDGDIDGMESILEISNNQVTINISETPVIIIVDSI